ncbi:MAG: hypothetical protein K2O18_16370 [Oscillospiraceae bacterium]|nr:hypothetical protein [Oscillospiraceae bacterium]
MTEKIKVPTFETLETFADQIDKKYASKEQMEAEVKAQVSRTYQPSGSVAFADLPELTEANLGKVYNVTGAFTTTDSFMEGAGAEYPAGTNVAVVKAGEDYKYDAMSGFVDLSAYAPSEQIAGDIAAAKTAAVTEANASTDEKLTAYIKAEDIEPITEEEIIALFNKK